MILELVRFRNPPGLSRDALIADAKATLPRWQANSDLLRKHYCSTLDRSEALGVYIWPSIAAAQAGHDGAWIAAAEARTGAPVHVEYLDLLMVLDKEANTMETPPASDFP